VISCPVLLKFLVSHSCWQISPSTTGIFIFLSVEKFVDLPAHLLSEDQQGTLPTLVKNALAVSLEQLIERSRSEFPLGFAQNRTMPDFSKKNTPEYPSTKIMNCTRYTDAHN
jgi:hypothetical protein